MKTIFFVISRVDTEMTMGEINRQVHVGRRSIPRSCLDGGFFKDFS